MAPLARRNINTEAPRFPRGRVIIAKGTALYQAEALVGLTVRF